MNSNVVSYKHASFQKAQAPTRKPIVLFQLIRAIAGRPIKKWAAPATLPQQTVEGFRLGADITLWRLPVGYVRTRKRHVRLEDVVADTPDAFRFPLMMADRRIGEWLTCTSWLIEHPEKTILVDTGEAPNFGSAAYFESSPKMTRRLYPRIIDVEVPKSQTLPRLLQIAGKELADIDQCVLTHLHSDHVGNLRLLAPNTQIVLAEAETRHLDRSGRLPEKLPHDKGRVQFAHATTPQPVFETAHTLTARGDIRMIHTPGHTIGHSSVLIDLGEQQILLAGDCAFNDQQVEEGSVPGIIENLSLLQQTYAKLRALQDVKPTTMLFTHDHENHDKLRSQFPSVGDGYCS